MGLWKKGGCQTSLTFFRRVVLGEGIGPMLVLSLVCVGINPAWGVAAKKAVGQKGVTPSTSKPRVGPQSANLGFLSVTPEIFRTMGIKTAKVRNGKISSFIVSPAYVEADDRSLVKIRPVGNGRVVKVYTYPGQVVVPGTPLLDYENYTLTDVINQVDAAKAVVEEAQAQKTEAAYAAQRGNLLQGGALPRGEVQRRQTVLQHMSGLVREKQALLHNMRMRLSQFSNNSETIFDGHYSRVMSPVSGMVKTINISMGDMIGSSSLPVVEIVNTSTVWVVSQVSSHNLDQVKIGNPQSTIIAEHTPSLPISSTVTTIDSSVDPITRQFLVRSEVKNTGKLRAGMFVRTRIYNTPQPGLVIPKEALQRIDDHFVVFVKVGPHRFACRIVVTGPSSDQDILIKKGLKEGDEIVTSGSFDLKSQLAMRQ
ncbi:efflux RND transporter periplasmic adaptor subunit [Entomobacter blattae]|nr:efflux RND transporter periplasmic adaptor subunit [Entomobacter blattae]